METKKKDLLDNIELRSEDVRDVLSNPPHWMVRWGNTIFFIILIILLIMSFLIKYPEYISSSIIITSKNPPEKIEARISSKIEKILVNNQQFIQKGDILIVFQSTGNYEDILKLKDIIDSTNVDNILNFPIHKTSQYRLGELQNEYNNFAKVFIDESLFRQLNPYDIEESSIERRISENKNQIYILEKQFDLEKYKYNLIKMNFERYSTLFNKGVISEEEFENERLNFLQAQQNLENIRLSISKLEDEAMILNKNKKNIDLNFIKDKVNYSSQTLLSFEQLRKSVIQWEQNYLITSSIDGTVSFQNFIETNQYIASGDVVLSIIPNEKKGLVGIMNIPSANSGKIQKNSKVLIKLDNYRYQEFGIIEGKVEYISLTPSKEGNYYVYITLPKGLKTSYGKDIIFNKEMTGRADIITEDMRLIERFFYQIRKLLGYQL